MINAHIYSNVNKHWSLRSHEIDTVTIHCAAGLASSLSICRYLDTHTSDCSANYVIGQDGDICIMIPEQYAAWTSSSAENDARAITIEVASDSKPPYQVPTLAMAALLDLLVDICSRYKFSLKWSWLSSSRINHVDGCNMTLHRDFNSNKSCPGEYLYDNMQAIADSVNRRLSEMNGSSLDPRYKTLNEIPECYRELISELVIDGVIRGRSNDNLDLSEDMIRVIVIIQRLVEFELDHFYKSYLED